MKKFFQSPRIHQLRKQAGVALVITLSLIVLVTIAVMAFFVRATAYRGIESSRANQILAEQLALTARDYVVGGLVNEIAMNSINIASPTSTPVYQANTNQFAVPQRPLPPFAGTTNFDNLVRLSVNLTANGVGETNASSHSTATPSKNGRVAGIASWNAPVLLSGGGFSALDQLPNWIYLNKNGTASAAASTNAVGRFAYAIYNIGGLLDINIAGSPNSVTGKNLAQIKNTLAGADLSLIPGILNEDFINWRNGTVSAESYVTNTTIYAQSGFLKPPGGTQVFLSRQDLIRFARLGSIGLETNALPFLTTFSRAVDAPSFTPSASRPMPDDTVNPSLINTRVSAAFPRPDGSEAKVGEPLLKKRFPLSRLALLENPPPVVNTTSDIYKFFGLTRSGAEEPWVYSHEAVNRIFKLGEITGREPDFFELLQACIAVGSLGKSLGKTHAYGAEGLPYGPAISPAVRDADVVRDNMPLYQILQIGANLIDQYDANSYPTEILLNDVNKFSFYGIENLPYLTRVFSTEYRTTGPPNTAGQTTLTYYLQPEVWNPHQSATSPPVPLGGGAGGPDKFRFVMEGAFRLRSIYITRNLPGRNISTSIPRPSLLFDSLAALSEPKLLAPPFATANDSKDRVVNSDGSIRFIGMNMGAFERVGNAELTSPDDQRGVYPDPYLSYVLQYERNGNWFTYNQMAMSKLPIQFGDRRSLLLNPPQTYPGPRWVLARSDPRVERFGFMMAAPTYSPSPGVTIRPDYTTDGMVLWNTTVRSSLYSGWTTKPSAFGPGWPYDYQLGALTDNKGGGDRTSYKDPDGVRRLGDAAFSEGAAGQPMETGNLDSRPVILNRPFRSVAEMGYAGRDLPWKTLDMLTDKSVDAPLLDAFCIDESSPLNIVAGLVDLNTRQELVLAAIFSGTGKKDAANTITAFQAEMIARAIRAPEPMPLKNKSEIPEFMTSKTSAGTAIGPVLDAAIKTRRESITRALSDVGQTRTWNLLADIIVQLGRFPTTATTAGDFLVEAEQRNWSSFAIDRPTASIISSQTEMVRE